MSNLLHRMSWLSAVCALSLLAACGDDDASRDDGGTSMTDGEVPDSATPDAGPSPLLDAPEAEEVGSLELDEPLAEVVYAADLVLGLHDESDVSILDVSDATAPRVISRLPTTGRAIAVTLDVELRVLFILTAQGDLRAYRVADPTTPAQVVQQTITEPDAPDDSTLRGMARVGNRLFLLGSARMIPVQILYGANGSVGFLAEDAVELDENPERIASGGSSLFIAFQGGRVQRWSTSSTPSKVDDAQLGAQITGWVVRGLRVFVSLRGLGVRVVDLSVPGTVQRVFDAPDLDDATALKRFGNLILLALSRGTIVALDLSDITSPRPLVTRRGTLPDWVAPAGGNLVLGTGTQLSVLGIPPFVNASVPRAIRRAFPRYGRIPLTLSKPIDRSTLAEGSIELRCGDVVIEGRVHVSPDGLRITFLPSEPLPAGASCRITFDGVKDVLGLDLSSVDSALDFDTVSEEPAPIENEKSSYPHTADGKMTNWEKDTTEDYEYSDVTPAVGMYSRFYADHDGERLWMLNDWFYNSDDIDPDCYNQFGVWTGNGSQQWQVRAYGDQRIEVWLNGEKLAEDDERVTGGYGHTATPNDEKLHTVYEIAIQTQPGSWGVQLHDPGPSFGCEQLETDPTTYNGASTDTGSSIDPTIAPTMPSEPSPRTGAVLTATPTLSWSTQDAPTSFTVYLLEIASGSNLNNVIYRVWVYGRSFSLPAGLLRLNGTYTWRVTAYNLAGTVSSDPVTFTVGEEQPVEIAAPVLSSADPSSIAQGGSAAITITGTGFIEGAVAYWNQTALATTFVSSTQVTAMVPASLTEQVGTYALTVRNDGDDADTASNDIKIDVVAEQSSCAHSECMPGDALASDCSSCAEAVCASNSDCCTSGWGPACVSAASASEACTCTAPALSSVSPDMVTANAQTQFTVTMTNAPAGATYTLLLVPSQGDEVTGSCIAQDANTCYTTIPVPAGTYDATVRVGSGATSFYTNTLDDAVVSSVPAGCVHSECLPGARLGSSCSSCAEAVCAEHETCCTSSWNEICVMFANQSDACSCSAPSLVNLGTLSGTEGSETAVQAFLDNGSEDADYQLVFLPQGGGSSTALDCTGFTDLSGVCTATVPGSLAAGTYTVWLRVIADSVQYDASSPTYEFTQNEPAGLSCFTGGNVADLNGAGTCASPFVFQLIGMQIGTTLAYTTTGGGSAETFGIDTMSCNWGAPANRIFQVQLPDGALGFDVSVDPIGSPEPFGNPRIAALGSNACTQPTTCVNDRAAEACEVARFTTAQYSGNNPFFVVALDDDTPSVPLTVRVRAF